MLRLATVGTSGITEMLISAVKKTDRFSLETAYSRNEETGRLFAEKHGFKSFTTELPRLAKSESIDAVYIASPNSLHYSQSKLFLENGINVFCEKPIVTEKKQLDELMCLAERNGVIYSEAIMSRHSEGRKILLDAINKIGNISIARIDFCQRSSRYDAFMSGTPMNIFDMSLAAGTLNDLGIYCVYAAVDLFGVPKSISAVSSFFDNCADKSGTAIFEYDSFTAVLTYSKAGRSAVGSEIVGDSGTVKIGSISQYGDISLVKNGKEELLYPLPSRDVVMGAEAVKFADYIEKLDAFSDDYSEASRLAKNVHTCMDIIRQDAGIKYSGG